MIRALAFHTVYVAAVLTAAVLGVLTAALLPITDPDLAWFACIAAGHAAAFTALAWLPCPCHRKAPR